MPLENLSLNKKHQPSFDVSVKRIRKRLKEGNQEDKEFTQISSDRGVVRLNHIPHGFFENEIRQYFRQFGEVTRLRVARSKKTGNSKGFAFVEFKFPDVAKVVAETMNNYLMFDKLLKATYIPPEEQKHNYFLGVNKDKVPAERNRKAAILKYNRILSQKEKEQFYSKVSQHLDNKLKKLKALGIDYDFKPINKLVKKKDMPVLTIDESDEEIAFKIPPNVKVVKRKSTSSAIRKSQLSPQLKTSSKREIVNQDDISAERNVFAGSDCNGLKGQVNEKSLKKSMRDYILDLDGGDSKKKNKVKAISKSKQNKVFSKTMKKETLIGPLALNSLKNIKKMNDTCNINIAKAKSSKSFLSMWKVKECS